MSDMRTTDLAERIIGTDIVWNTARDRLPSLSADARRALGRISGSME